MSKAGAASAATAASPEISDELLDKELLAGLDKEELEYKKDAEIARILNSFKLDAYSILELQPGVTETDIKIQFRKKSLLIHPDKTKNPQAPDAFDRLKKAQAELSDEKLRTRLDEAFADARMLLIRERKWTVDNEELKTDEFMVDWREKTKTVLIDNELRRRKQMKAQLQEEGREMRKQEAELDARKRKRESEQAWEETRDQRINSWRSFHKNTGEKKKKKAKPLG
jgi:DnaJ family protein C protein 8